MQILSRNLHTLESLVSVDFVHLTKGTFITYILCKSEDICKKDTVTSFTSPCYERTIHSTLASPQTFSSLCLLLLFLEGYAYIVSCYVSASYLLGTDRFILRLLNQYSHHVLLTNYMSLNRNHVSQRLK